MPNNDYPTFSRPRPCLNVGITGAIYPPAETLSVLEPEPVSALKHYQMAEMGIGACYAVSIESRRGSIEIRVRADRDGMAFILFCLTEVAAKILPKP